MTGPRLRQLRDNFFLKSFFKESAHPVCAWPSLYLGSAIYFFHDFSRYLATDKAKVFCFGGRFGFFMGLHRLSFRLFLRKQYTPQTNNS